MALDIVAKDIIIDETTGDQSPPEGDDSPVSNETVTYLLSLDSAGGLTPPEVAFKADFVVASASAGETITGIVLTQNATGTPFSTTVGVNSGIRTVDGNYVWLFQDATHANVVIGVIGTSDQLAEPAETGPLAYSFALINTSNTNADLYTVQYVPLRHPDATNPDDRIDLTDHVFASVAGTSVNNFSGQNAAPGNHDFYLINSSNDASKQLLVTGFSGEANATANVSTQGFGVNNQSINPTETLQTDFVTGGNLPAGSASQIQYGSHLDGVMQAGFTINQVTPSSPNLRVDIKIQAFDVTGNEQGLNFYDGSPTTAAPITSLKLTGASGFGSPITANGVYATTSGNVNVSGLGTDAVTITGLDNVTTVDVTTSSQMDRLTVTGVDSNEGLDITEFHFSTTTTSAHSEEVGSFINFDDDGPSITASTTNVPTLTVDETIFTTDASAPFAGLFTSDPGADGDAISYKLGISAPNVASGLVDTLTNEAVTLSVNAAGTVVTGSSATGGTVFTITLNADTGNVTLDQVRAVVHDDPNDPDESSSPAQLTAASLVTLTAKITDGDLDTATATRNIGDAFKFEDDGPTITAAFDADPVAPDIQTPEQLGNADGETASGTFGYNIGADGRLVYDATHSDFVDANGAAGIQIGLTGTVSNAQNPAITQAVATLTAENSTSASFNFSFHYDKDPIAAGVQDSTAGGTLVFDKALDTYTFTLTDVVEGFTFDVLHTAELIAKQPTSNTGHPLIVAEQLTPNGDPSPFFVQFTANSITQAIGFGFNSTGDGALTPPIDVEFTQGAHDMVTNGNEDWVSATQATNGVAGDTIQKGELLTLRFFQQDILGDVATGNERLEPTTSASGVVVKFDGIGNSEDLVLVLDLKDATGGEVTRAVNVQNSDLFKGNNVPAPYNTEFTLDSNDALLIIEQNDYTVAGETYQIQGMQIMQGANALTGNAINLNGATGANGGSSATSNLTAWDATDNDVLKIVDIGFVQQTSGTIAANLDFGVALADADGDQTALQHIPVHIA